MSLPTFSLVGSQSQSAPGQKSPLRGMLKSKFVAVIMFLFPFLLYIIYIGLFGKYTYICTALGDTDQPGILVCYIVYFLVLPAYLWKCYKHSKTMMYICASVCILWELQIAVAAIDHAVGRKETWVAPLHYLVTIMVLIAGAVQLDYGMIEDRTSWWRMYPYFGVITYLATFAIVKIVFPPSAASQAVAVTLELFGFVVLLGRLIFFRFAMLGGVHSPMGVDVDDELKDDGIVPTCVVNIEDNAQLSGAEMTTMI
jgi:hypothetical protein